MGWALHGFNLVRLIWGRLLVLICWRSGRSLHSWWYCSNHFRTLCRFYRCQSAHRWRLSHCSHRSSLKVEVEYPQKLIFVYRSDWIFSPHFPHDDLLASVFVEISTNVSVFTSESANMDSFSSRSSANNGRILTIVVMLVAMLVVVCGGVFVCDCILLPNWVIIYILFHNCDTKRTNTK